jgi:L-serine dehydratase
MLIMQPVREAISVFDMFKIGIGPSSSHTLGPWKAALACLDSIQQKVYVSDVLDVRVCLYGSLAKTGRGHGTDIAVMMGLMGADPVHFPVESVAAVIQKVKDNGKLALQGTHPISFDPATHIQFLVNETLPFHPNGMSFLITLDNGETISETYYSIGGGFVVKEGDQQTSGSNFELPFAINTADDLLRHCMKGMAIYEVVMENEASWRPEAATRAGLLRIWQVMQECIYKGCQ